MCGLMVQARVGPQSELNGCQSNQNDDIRIRFGGAGSKHGSNGTSFCKGRVLYCCFYVVLGLPFSKPGCAF
jgi:hypothetical protein